MKRKTWQVLAGLVLVASAGCAVDDGTEDGAAADAQATVPAATAPAGPGDAEIAMIVLVANSADSVSGEAAKVKGEGAEIREYGQRMITDHSALNAQATELAGRLGVTPVESDLSRQLQTDAQAHMQSLAGLTGAAFDRAYIDHEVMMHQQLLDALDQTLIPAAQNGELKALLESARPAVAAHLESARSIQAGLGQ